jgi:hypothetical protein
MRFFLMNYKLKYGSVQGSISIIGILEELQNSFAIWTLQSIVFKDIINVPGGMPSDRSHNSTQIAKLNSCLNRFSQKKLKVYPKRKQVVV